MLAVSRKISIRFNWKILYEGITVRSFVLSQIKGAKFLGILHNLTYD